MARKSHRTNGGTILRSSNRRGRLLSFGNKSDNDQNVYDRKPHVEYDVCERSGGHIDLG
ncbi:hypothetical protein D3C86_1820530 [compost metagenome]